MIRLLVIALLAMLSLPAWAGTGDFSIALPLISGNFDESVELTLRALSVGNGARARGTTCHVSVKVEALDATAVNPTSVSESAELEPGKLFVFDLPLARIHYLGRVHVALQVSGSGVSRSCPLEIRNALTETSTGKTLGVPVHIPIHVCGSGANLVGIAGPGFGNNCPDG